MKEEETPEVTVNLHGIRRSPDFVEPGYKFQVQGFKTVFWIKAGSPLDVRLVTEDGVKVLFLASDEKPDILVQEEA